MKKARGVLVGLATALAAQLWVGCSTSPEYFYTGALCAAAGGRCLVGPTPCTPAPEQAQDCAPSGNPGDDQCCIAEDGGQQ